MLVMGVVGVACGSTVAHYSEPSAPAAAEPAPSCQPMPRAKRIWVGFGPGQNRGDMEAALDEMHLIQQLLGNAYCHAAEPTQPASLSIAALEFHGASLDAADVTLTTSDGESKLVVVKEVGVWKIVPPAGK
jgi:hypothetical protein